MSQHTNRRRLPGTPLMVLIAFGAACSDMVAPEGGSIVSTFVNPLSGLTFFVDASSRAKATADDWRVTRPGDAAIMDRIASAPQAKWFGDWNANVEGDVARAVSGAATSNSLPVLVAYNIPQRDCGGLSAGGATSGDSYRSWISAFARGLGGSKAVVVLEPDALAALDCLSPDAQQQRTGLLAFAVSALRDLGALVYLDGGHSRWKSPEVMAARLRDAGIAQATGFALNVSNFQLTADEIRYGNAISAHTGGKHYVIDTSRNGLGPTADNQWCNPDGRALGPRPTTATGETLVDAFLWIKMPGESDGACNGAPAAGAWMPEYALAMAKRAGY